MHHGGVYFSEHGSYFESPADGSRKPPQRGRNEAADVECRTAATCLRLFTSLLTMSVISVVLSVFGVLLSGKSRISHVLTYYTETYKLWIS